MKSLDKILKERKSLALADELLKNYNSQINSILKGFKMKNDFTTLNETLNTTKEQLAMNSFLNNTLPAESLPTIDEQLKKFGETITGTPAPQNQGGQEIIVSDNYTTNSQILGGNKQNFKKEKKPPLKLVTAQTLTAYTREQIENEMPAEFLMPGKFLERGAITGIYAKKGTGKTFLSFAIIQYILLHKKDYKILVFDADNSAKTLKARGLLELMELYGERLKVFGSKLNFTNAKGEQEKIKPRELLAHLAQSYDYENADLSETIIILDTARKFINGDLNSDKVLDVEFFEPLESLRAQGATIIYYHHTTKGKGQDLDGDLICKNSGGFADNGENLFELTRIDEIDGIATMSLKVTDYGKSRDKFEPIAFTLPISPETMAGAIKSQRQAFQIADYGVAALNDGGEKQEMKDALIESLAGGKTLKQNELRQAMKALLKDIGASKILSFINEFGGYLCDIQTADKNAKLYTLKSTSTAKIYELD